jgi:hypothetical protein
MDLEFLYVHSLADFQGKTANDQSGWKRSISVMPMLTESLGKFHSHTDVSNMIPILTNRSIEPKVPPRQMVSRCISRNYVDDLKIREMENRMRWQVQRITSRGSMRLGNREINLYMVRFRFR